MSDVARAVTPAFNDVAAAIRSANQQFMDAFRQKDASRLATLYAHNGLLLPPGGSITEGTEAITRFWKGAMDMGITDVTLNTVSVEPLGETALEIGEYTLMAAGSKVDHGKYLVVWRLEKNVWKLYRDVWNTSAG